ncbi:MAG: alpha/beta fold hydrolase [Pseudomonadota bacterium]
MESSRVRWGAFLMLLAVAACGNTGDNVPLVSPIPDAGTTHPLLVATNRAPAEDPLERFSGERAGALAFEDVSVWVPADRAPGTIAFPTETPRPETQFATTAMRSLSGRAELLANINARLAEAPADEKIVFIFVHGYNVSYAAGLYRQAQMLEDFQAGGVGMLFSWPSSGRLLGYVYDRDSVQFARDDLADVISVAAQSNAESVFLMGHSMGTLLVMEALRQLSLSGERQVLSRISPLVLASPDIDVDVFRLQHDAIEPRPDPFIVMVSQRDNALRVSHTIRGGHPRVGEGQDIQALQEGGITVVDLSTLDDDGGIGHTTFASSPTLIRIFGEVSTMQQTIQEAGNGQSASPLEILRIRAGNLLHPPR